MERQIEMAERRMIVPLCSISEDSGVVTVKVEMPGVAKSGLEVKIEGNSLTVTGTRSTGEPRGTYLLRERRGENYAKSFTIDETIDREKIQAELAEGILTLKLAIKEAAKPRRIAIA